MTRKSEFIGDTKGLPLTPQVKAFGLAGLAALGFSLAACGNGSAGSATGANETPTRASTQASPTNAQGNTVDVSLIGKIDATSGTPGTFTGKDGWPALAPANFTVPHGARVVLTIREFDDMNTPLRPMMPYNTVEGGAETVDGSPVTSVDNAHIAHTFTVPSLGINVPLPMAPKDGFTTVTFTFLVGKAGTYRWRCFTPCGDSMMGMGGAMITPGWMTGILTVS